MKRGLLFIILLLLVNPVLALDFNLSKTSYSPYETLIGSISGDFIATPEASNLFFYRDSRQVSMVSDLAKIGDKFYFYALLPGEQANYSLILKNLSYKENNSLKKQDLSLNFTISGNESAVRVSPGFITALEDFSLDFENKGPAKEMSVKLSSQTQTFSLSENATKKIYFSIQNLSGYQGEIEVKADSKKIYDIPVIVKAIQNITNHSVEQYQFNFKDKELNLTLKIGEVWLFSTELYNQGETNISKIKLTSNLDYLGLNPEEFSLGPGEKQMINISVSSNKLGNHTGLITASFDKIKTNITINLNFTDNSTSIVSDNQNLTSDCKDGVFCGSDSVCSGQEINLGLAVCCNGICIEKPKSSGKLSWGIIILILVILIVIAVFIYIKYKGKPRTDVLVKKSEAFDKSIKPTSSSSS